MHTLKTLAKQNGFFDLGLSLIILAIGGGTTYLVKEAHEEQLAAEMQVESVELVYSESSNEGNE